MGSFLKFHGRFVTRSVGGGSESAPPLDPETAFQSVRGVRLVCVCVRERERERVVAREFYLKNPNPPGAAHAT